MKYLKCSVLFYDGSKWIGKERDLELNRVKSIVRNYIEDDKFTVTMRNGETLTITDDFKTIGGKLNDYGRKTEDCC